MEAQLWAFLLAIYARPGVQEACLEVQEAAGADIVLLLVWAGSLRPGQASLGGASIAALQHEVADWRQRCIRPLRQLRTELKSPGTLPEAERHALREKIKALELGAERTEVTLIARYLALHPPLPDEDAADGLALLLSDTKPSAAALDLIRRAALSL